MSEKFKKIVKQEWPDVLEAAIVMAWVSSRPPDANTNFKKKPKFGL